MTPVLLHGEQGEIGAPGRAGQIFRLHPRENRRVVVFDDARRGHGRSDHGILRSREVVPHGYVVHGLPPFRETSYRGSMSLPLHLGQTGVSDADLNFLPHSRQMTSILMPPSVPASVC